MIKMNIKEATTEELIKEVFGEVDKGLKLNNEEISYSDIIQLLKS